MIGLAWSADGTGMYSVDTLRATVFVRDYESITGAVGEWRVHLDVAAQSPMGLRSMPDEHLLVAVWAQARCTATT